MRDLRAFTRRVLRLAQGAEEPDLAGLREALPAILARARTERAARAPATTLEAVLPLGRRLVPAMAAAAASLALGAWLLGQSAAAPAVEAGGEAWESSLLAQAADEAQASDVEAEELLP